MNKRWTPYPSAFMLADQEEDEDPVPVRLNADREEGGDLFTGQRRRKQSPKL
jgi:hypothetical protein